MPPLVIDPVSVSTSHHTLLSASAIKDLVFELLPQATIVTPNAVEAGMIAWCIQAGGRAGGQDIDEVKLGEAVRQSSNDKGVEVKSLEDMVSVGQTIAEFIKAQRSSFPDTTLGVLVKGGHIPFKADVFKSQLKQFKSQASSTSLAIVWNETAVDPEADEDDIFTEVLDMYRRQQNGSPTSTALQDTIKSQSQSDKSISLMVDVLITKNQASGNQVTLFVAPAISSTSTHGTGCTLSAAIASQLGSGQNSTFYDKRCFRIPLSNPMTDP